MMIAIPLALVIQRNDEQVASLQGLQHPSAVFLAGDGIAQRAAQPVEDGGLEQEAADTFGLTLQDFFDQIVQHETVSAGEGPDEPGGVLSPLHRERGQLQAGDPAFGAGFQGGDVFRREVQAHHLVEKFGGFGRGKTQVGGAQLGQLAPGAQAGQGQLWVLAGGDDQVHLRRQVLEQKGEGIVDRSGIDHVVVVKDEDEIVRDGGDFVEQGRQDRFGRRWLRGLERTQHPCSNLRRNRLQGGDEVGQKAGGVVIPFVQRQPGGRSRRNRRPIR